MNRTCVSQSDLEESVEVVIAGYQRKGAVIPPEEKKIVAYHEIGHALVAALQKNQLLSIKLRLSLVHLEPWVILCRFLKLIMY